MAARAVEIVAELRRHDDYSFERVELPSELIVRESTRRRRSEHNAAGKSG
jgi:LacI family transcriptional regulator